MLFPLESYDFLKESFFLKENAVFVFNSFFRVLPGRNLFFIGLIAKIYKKAWNSGQKHFKLAFSHFSFKNGGKTPFQKIVTF